MNSRRPSPHRLQKSTGNPRPSYTNRILGQFKKQIGVLESQRMVAEITVRDLFLEPTD